jgi:hypothetical protein
MLVKFLELDKPQFALPVRLGCVVVPKRRARTWSGEKKQKQHAGNFFRVDKRQFT